MTMTGLLSWQWSSKETLTRYWILGLSVGAAELRGARAKVKRRKGLGERGWKTCWFVEVRIWSWAYKVVVWIAG